MPPMSISPMLPSLLLGIAVGCPHVVSHVVMRSISGVCAPMICAARAFTLAEEPNFSARSAICTACSWCGIISWAKAMSLAEPGASSAWALVEARAGLPAVCVLVWVLEPHATSSIVRVRVVAARARGHAHRVVLLGSGRHDRQRACRVGNRQGQAAT